MKADRKRVLLEKALRKELKLYLSAFNPKHPYYKRNIKNLYEGLNELGIFTDIDVQVNFKEFEKAFHNADKSVKELLVTTHVFDEVNLGAFYKYKGKPVNKLKLIGNVFVHRAINPKLNENQYLGFLQKKAYREMLLRDRQDLRDVKNALKEFRKEFKTTKKDLDKVRQVIDQYHAIANQIEKTHSFSTPENSLYHSLNTWDEENWDDEREHQEANKLIKFAEQRIDDSLTHLEKRIINNTASMKNYEYLEDTTLKKLDTIKSSTNHQLKVLNERFKIYQSFVHDNPILNKSIKEMIPNVVKGLTDVINLRKQLDNFLQFLDSKRMSLNDPWRVVGYGSGGADKRAGRNKAIASLALQVGVNAEHVEKTLGDTREGFWKRDMDWIAKELVKYEDLFYKYLGFIPKSTLHTRLNDLLWNISNLMNYLITDFFEEEHIFRNEMGQITNIDEHELTMKLVKEIQKAFADCMKVTRDCIILCDNFTEYNENLIVEAKAKKLNARKQMLEIDKYQRKIETLLARRKVRTTENGME